ncbi:MAG: hypothetical protein WA628_25225 [Terriglobales bacterium]
MNHSFLWSTADLNQLLLGYENDKADFRRQRARRIGVVARADPFGKHGADTFDPHDGTCHFCQFAGWHLMT